MSTSSSVSSPTSIDAQQAQPDWKAEVAKKRIQNERARDVEKKWDHMIRTEGEGQAPWLQEVAKKKKAMKEKEEEEAKVPQWLREVEKKNPGLMKSFSTEESN